MLFGLLLQCLLDRMNPKKFKRIGSSQGIRGNNETSKDRQQNRGVSGISKAQRLATTQLR